MSGLISISAPGASVAYKEALFDRQGRSIMNHAVARLLSWALLSMAVHAVHGEALLGSDEAVVNSGHVLYQVHCASCHGTAADGGAALDIKATVKTPDLTQLAKKNGGQFPIWELYEVISGSELLPAHGRGPMPSWGTALAKAPGVNEDDAVAIVRGRIFSILAYLATVQVK